ncbi:MAG: DNA primase [Crocinitomicaceae bacterium]|nr:DNA primase [Crocinitomicaceae bacterium]
MIPKQTIDEIFQAARVEEVIGEFVHLKKSGSSYKAKSPFVDEKTPSFMVSPAKQIWKCFSSGKGGNVVSFIMEHEHFSYVEALRWLANKYQIAIKEDREQTAEEIAEISIRENLSVINEFAKNHFADNIINHEQGRAIGMSYFKERGFREDIITKFQLGYCLDESEGFTKRALEKGYKLEYLEKAGLTKTKDGRHFDFFRGRVMFPIHSVAGKVLGFGGRTLKTEKSVAKYFNSPETELYNKSKILYGLYFAKNSIIKSDRCFLVEGYTDVISLHQSGLENVVASSGTSLTIDQIKLIKRYTDNITILYDGDAAGIRASFRGIDMILEEGLNVKVVLFPDGDDPDSFAKKHSYSELEKYIADSSKDFVVFKSDILIKDAGGDPVKKAALIRDIITSISVIPDAIKRQVYLRECATMFGMEEQVLITEVLKLRKTKSAGDQRSAQNLEEAAFYESQMEQPLVAPTTDVLYHQEYDLIRILLHYGLLYTPFETIEVDEEGKEQVVEIEIPVVQLIAAEIERDELEIEHPVLKLIYEEMRDGVENGVMHEDSYFLRHSNPEIAKAAADIMSDKHEISPNWSEQNVRINHEVDKLHQAVMSCLYSYKNTKIILAMKKIQDEIDQLDDDHFDEIMTLMARQRQLEQVKILFASKLGRIII